MLNDMGTIKWVKGSSHDISDWYFDPKTGRTLDKKGGKIVFPLSTVVQQGLREDMKRFASLKKKWKKSGGKLTSSEKLFLDAAQCMVLSRSMAEAAKLGSAKVAKLKKKADAEVEAIWGQIDFHSYSALTYWEVESLFASRGVSRSAFVDDFQTKTASVSDKFRQLSEDFQMLKQQIDSGVSELEARDQSFAKEFTGWTNSI
ncbi:hypothetical protein J2T50_000778 [Streptococcus gallinaceus]|uniref:hypothetical protein n=1 Tax=Streptococcus gallinaceus TaxID=165758 RepID=UPI0020A1B09A|nr:hypothetical protein [Streptococcus gallinaceus]MCP1639083.1 hypothetical protein [Streptococcus gallinaceus]MCP1769673.1 hypothetical protein [Streptococcus gallinaceus]